MHRDTLTRISGYREGGGEKGLPGRAAVDHADVGDGTRPGHVDPGPAIAGMVTPTVKAQGRATLGAQNGAGVGEGTRAAHVHTDAALAATTVTAVAKTSRCDAAPPALAGGDEPLVVQATAAREHQAVAAGTAGTTDIPRGAANAAAAARDRPGVDENSPDPGTGTAVAAAIAGEVKRTAGIATGPAGNSPLVRRMECARKRDRHGTGGTAATANAGRSARAPQDRASIAETATSRQAHRHAGRPAIAAGAVRTVHPPNKPVIGQRNRSAARDDAKPADDGRVWRERRPVRDSAAVGEADANPHGRARAAHDGAGI